jgi:ribosome-binding factor A
MRLERIASFIKREVSDIIRNKLSNQKIGFVTITHIKITKDLSSAKIYYSQLGSDAEKKNTLARLKNAAVFVKYELGKVLQTKTVPNLIFVFDKSIEQGVQVINKLNEISTPEKE